ncbi:waprin-Thr1-like [Aphomia sociella]
MGLFAILVTLFAVVIVISSTEAAGNCPLPSKVYGCSPKCVQDYECTHGKVCCANACNAKSCTQPAANGSGGSSSNKYSGGAGVYCDNVKCSAYEVCKPDPVTKRNKCGRA